MKRFNEFLMVVLIFSPWIVFFIWVTLMNRVDLGVLITPVSWM